MEKSFGSKMADKWFTRVIVAAAIIDTLDSLKLNYLKVSSAKPKELAKRALLASN